MRPAATLFAFFLSALVPATALAGEPDVAEDATPRRTTEERPFVYVVDPTVASRGTVAVESSIGVGSGVAALRPLPSTSDARTTETSLTVGVGVGGGLEPFVTGVRGFGDAPGGAGVIAGLRWQITPSDGPFRVGLVGAGFREPGGAMGGYARVTASYDVERLRIGGNLHVEKVGGVGRDGADMLATFGVSYRALPGLRLGAEYVGQDLEEVGGGAEGGAKHYAGPTFAVDLDHGRAQIVAGPAIGLGANSARWLGRASVVVSF